MILKIKCMTFWLGFMFFLKCVNCGGESKEDSGESSEEDQASRDSNIKHPYVASLVINGSHACNAVILNRYWMITVSKCVTWEHPSGMNSVKVRIGSNYGNEGGNLFWISLTKTSFEYRLSLLKVRGPITFSSQVSAANLPREHSPLQIGYQVDMTAWANDGYIRTVTASLLPSSQCRGYTKLPLDYVLCVSGAVDRDDGICHKDHGGAVIHNNTLIGITTFIHPCAQYDKIHAFPKTSSAIPWINSIIWDEKDASWNPQLLSAKTQPGNDYKVERVSRAPEADDFLATLPYEPIDVPLEPAGADQVMHGMSLYESYIRTLKRQQTSTSPKPKRTTEKSRKRESKKNQWLKLYSEEFKNYARQNMPLEYNKMGRTYSRL